MKAIKPGDKVRLKPERYWQLPEPSSRKENVLKWLAMGSVLAAASIALYWILNS